MTINIFEHEAGCSPFNYCRACKAVAYLRQQMKPQAFEEFIRMVHDVGAKEPAALESPVSMLGKISVRLANALQNDNLETIGDIVNKRKLDFRRMPNLGKHSINELEAALARVGHRLKDHTCD